MQKKYVGEMIVEEVFNTLKEASENNRISPSLWEMCYSIKSANSYSSIQKAVQELKRRKWIKAKPTRINNVVQYQIIRKD